MGTITERDTGLAKLSGKFEKNLLALNERDKLLTSLEYEKRRLLETNTIASNNNSAMSQECASKVKALHIENDQYVQKLNETQEKLLEVSRKLDSELEVNKVLREQINELITLNKSIHTSASNHPARRFRNDNREHDRESESGALEEEDEYDEEETTDDVVILHDSMCRFINDTLLSRENVKVAKVWAPDIEAMEEALDHVNAKVVVLQAFTRDLGKMEVDEMCQKIVGLVSKALTKAEKVVVSTIIRREDIVDIDLKADLVNAHVILKYKRIEKVGICHNYKLYDGRFMNQDKLHLNDNGIRLFASNLKYAIAFAAT